MKKLKQSTKVAVRELFQEFEKKIQANEISNQNLSLASVGMGTQEIEILFRQMGEKHCIKLGDLAQPVRLAVTGRMVSAGLFELMAILPWEIVKIRVKKIESI